MENHPPHVGIGVMIVKNGKILLGKRKNAHGASQWAPPGGHLEYGESFTDCAKREAQEEIGCELKNIKFLRLFRETAHLPKDMVNIVLIAEIASGTPTVCEPDKCESWEWFDIDNLPTPLMSPVPSMIEAYNTGRTFFDS